MQTLIFFLVLLGSGQLFIGVHHWSLDLLRSLTALYSVELGEAGSRVEVNPAH